MAKFKYCIYILILTLLSSASLFSQIKIKELNSYPVNEAELYQESSETREIVYLRSNWEIYVEDAPASRNKVTVPNTFTGVDELVYETSFDLSKEQISGKLLFLNFTGLSYSAEVFVNDEVVSKIEFGQIPERIEIPRDILSFDKKNKLVVKVIHELDDINTIPVNKNFLSPECHGGIFRDVYLELVPDSFIKIINKDYSFADGLKSAQIKIDLEINNFVLKSDTNNVDGNNYQLIYSLVDPAGSVVDNYSENVIVENNDIVKKTIERRVAAPKLWSPSQPDVYKYEITISQNGRLIDKVGSTYSFYSLSKDEDGLKLNGNSFQLRGTGYYLQVSENANLIPFSDHKKLLDKIESTGFNAVRFKDIIPTPNSLKYCEKIGLLVLVDVPLNSIPENISTDITFVERAKRYTNKFYSYYKNFNSIALFGLGNSYLANSADHKVLIQQLAEALNGQTSDLTYASFVGLQTEQINEIDFYGIELFSRYNDGLFNSLEKLTTNNYFISEINYAVFKSESVGYINPNTVEAQAKHIESVLEFADEKNLSGVFIKSLYDYKGESSSFFTSYNRERVFNIGILGENRNETNPSYQVVSSFLKDQNKVRIPIGSKKEDRSLLFIISALILSVFMGLLINSKRKFREDASRALIRPYNFFADIRDMRIISGIHTNILMIILVLTHSLLLTNILYFLRSNMLVEKFLLAFDSSKLVNFFAMLAWNPEEALIYFAIFSVGIIILLTLVAKFSTVFIKTRVMFSSIYFIIIWAFLPLTLILPLLLLLYKVLLLEIANYFIYAFLLLYLVWMVQRLLKGIYIIFDIPAVKIYFYSIALLILIFGGTLFYYHMTESTVYYIVNSYKQFLLI